MSDAGVTDPDKWHMYPAGAHHKLTECSPTLHYMVDEHRPDLKQETDFVEAGQFRDVSVKSKPISPEDLEMTPEGIFLKGSNEPRFSQRQMREIVDKAQESVRAEMQERLDRIGELRQAAAMSDERAQRPIDQTAFQAPHRCARFMLLQFFDGTDFRVDFQNPNFQGGWKVRKMNGVEVLIVGHGVPRQTFPLCNVKYMSLIPEDMQ